MSSFKKEPSKNKTLKSNLLERMEIKPRTPKSQRRTTPTETSTSPSSQSSLLKCSVKKKQEVKRGDFAVDNISAVVKDSAKCKPLHTDDVRESYKIKTTRTPKPQWRARPIEISTNLPQQLPTKLNEKTSPKNGTNKRLLVTENESEYPKPKISTKSDLIKFIFKPKNTSQSRYRAMDKETATNVREMSSTKYDDPSLMPSTSKTIF